MSGHSVGAFYHMQFHCRLKPPCLLQRWNILRGRYPGLRVSIAAKVLKVLRLRNTPVLHAQWHIYDIQAVGKMPKFLKPKRRKINNDTNKNRGVWFDGFNWSDPTALRFLFPFVFHSDIECNPFILLDIELKKMHISQKQSHLSAKFEAHSEVEPSKVK